MMGTFKPRLQRILRTCSWESPRFIIICDVIEWNEPSLFNGAICPQRSAYAVLPSASCRGHQRMHHQRRKKWTRATRTTTMSKRWDYFHNYFPLWGDPISLISPTNTCQSTHMRGACILFYYYCCYYWYWWWCFLQCCCLLLQQGWLLFLRLMFFIHIFLHPSLEIKQKIHKAFHNILSSIIFSQWKCVFRVF